VVCFDHDLGQDIAIERYTNGGMNKTQAKQKVMRDALKWCDNNDKSTEFALEFIAQEASATLDEVLDFLMDNDQ
jgi:hypothetical protein